MLRTDIFFVCVQVFIANFVILKIYVDNGSVKFSISYDVFIIVKYLPELNFHFEFI